MHSKTHPKDNLLTSDTRTTYNDTDGASCLEFALKYRELGFSVIPVNSKNKTGCAFPWKPFQTRLATCDEIKKWWDEYPNHGVAIITGEVSGIIVLDLDCREAFDGIVEAQERFGFPEAHGHYIYAQTGGNGRHYIFKHPGFGVRNHSGAGAIAPGVEVKGSGAVLSG